MSSVIAVTTYKKTAALRGSLEGYVHLTDTPEDIEAIIVADDNEGEALPIAEEFQSKYEKGEYPYPIKYATGPNGGVWRNKNRCLKVFLEECSADHLVMVDDDLAWRKCDYRFREPYFLKYLLKAHEHTNRPHILGIISWCWKDPLEGPTYFKTFPPLGEDDYCVYVQGAQGVMLSFTREAVEKTGYMDRMKANYGFEHILYSARMNRLTGYDPILFPVLKNCSSYFTCANIPNGYDVDPAWIKTNDKQYQGRMQDVLHGVDLLVKRWE